MCEGSGVGRVGHPTLGEGAHRKEEKKKDFTDIEVALSKLLPAAINLPCGRTALQIQQDFFLDSFFVVLLWACIFIIFFSVPNVNATLLVALCVTEPEQVPGLVILTMAA